MKEYPEHIDRELGKYRHKVKDPFNCTTDILDLKNFSFLRQLKPSRRLLAASLIIGTVLVAALVSSLSVSGSEASNPAFINTHTHIETVLGYFHQDNYVRLKPLAYTFHYPTPSITPIVDRQTTISGLNLSKADVTPSISPTPTPIYVYPGPVWTNACPNPHLVRHSDVSFKNPSIKLVLLTYSDTDSATMQSVQDGSYAANVIQNISPALTELWGAAFNLAYQPIDYKGWIAMPGSVSQFNDPGTIMNTARNYLPAGTEDYVNGNVAIVLYNSVSTNSWSSGWQPNYGPDPVTGGLMVAGEIYEPSEVTTTTSESNNKMLAHEEGNSTGLDENNVPNDIQSLSAENVDSFNQLIVSSVDEQALCSIPTPIPTPNRIYYQLLPEIDN